MFRSRYTFDPPDFFGGRPRWVLRWLAAAILLGAIAAIGAYAFQVGKRLAGSAQSVWAVQLSHKVQVDELAEAVGKMEAEINALTALKGQGSGMTNVERAISTLQSEVASIRKTQARIEAVLLPDPAKALEVPLILREIEAMKQVQQIAQASLKQDVERLFLLGVGIVGIILTGFVAVLFAPRAHIREKSANTSN